MLYSIMQAGLCDAELAFHSELNIATPNPLELGGDRTEELLFSQFRRFSHAIGLRCSYSPKSTPIMRDF
ncbi:hypothetical protein, partial [Paenibacillus odorifer]|uniref:hypothetical protein n=1 Tax=Paenibacillus odorifer TaxID=189426 RepID=UPI001C4B8DE1